MRNDIIAVGNRRLLKLADFLDALPDERFEFNHFVDESVWEGKLDLSCGTTACAMGWATTMPMFRKLGLRMLKPDPFRNATPGIVGDDCHITYDGDTEVRACDRACERLFGLAPKETEQLFIPDYYGARGGLGEHATRKEVSDNIRAFVASPGRGNGRV